MAERKSGVSNCPSVEGNLRSAHLPHKIIQMLARGISVGEYDVGVWFCEQDAADPACLRTHHAMMDGDEIVRGEHL